MSTKINIPLLIMALMIQCLFVGILTIMPVSITSTMPTFANPLASLAASSISPSVNYGIAALGAGSWSCSTGALECIAACFEFIWQFILMSVAIIIYLALILFNIVMFFILSVIDSLYVFSGFPSFISIPLTLLVLIANLIVVIDISLVAKGLIENII